MIILIWLCYESVPVTTHIRVEKSDFVEKNQISLDLGPQNQEKSEKSGQLGTLR